MRLAALTVSTPLFGAQANHLKPAAKANRRSQGGSNGFAGTLRDRLWSSVATGGRAMTPAESALYLGVPNVILTRSASGQSFGRQWALSLSGFMQVIWPTDGHEHLIGTVRPLLAEFANITGVLLDGRMQSKLTELNRTKSALGHKDMWVNIDSESLNALEAGNEPLQGASVVVLWPGGNEKLEVALTRLARQTPAADLLLGCSLQRDPEHQSISRVRDQCELALKWIRSNRIGGLVFGAGTGITGDSEVVTQIRQWIGEVGGQKL